MSRKLLTTLIIVVIGGSVFAQPLKFRIAGNTSGFNEEVGEAEIPHPFVESLSDPNATDWTSEYKMGFEAEIMIPWTKNFETGIEFDVSNYFGINQLPPYYNFYFSDDKPRFENGTAVPIYTTEPKVFESNSMSFYLNLRYYFLANKRLSPFVKGFIGSSMVKTEFNYEDPEVWEAQDLPEDFETVLYKNSSRESGFTYGGGAGFNFGMSEKLSIYLDGNVIYMGSGLIDGVPNYNYVNTNGSESLVPLDGKSMIYQFSVGFVFTTETDLGITGGGSSGKSKGVKRGGGTTSKHLPWYRKK